MCIYIYTCVCAYIHAPFLCDSFMMGYSDALHVVLAKGQASREVPAEKEKPCLRAASVTKHWSPPDQLMLMAKIEMPAP